MAKKPYQYLPMPTRVINQQIAAMRFLASLGLSAEEIRMFSTGNIDLLYRVIRINIPMVSILHDMDSNLTFKQETTRMV